jgi:hypothetical protein
MSLLTTLITLIVYRNWSCQGEYCTYDSRGACIPEHQPPDGANGS